MADIEKSGIETTSNSLIEKSEGQKPSEIGDDARSGETIKRAFKKLSEQRPPEEMVEMTAMMSGMMGHPLHQKMNEGHINKMLDLATQHDTNEFDLRKNQQRIDEHCEEGERRHRLIYFCIFVALMIFILGLFRNQPSVLAPILSGVAGAVGGFFGGIGYARVNSTPKRKNE